MSRTFTKNLSNYAALPIGTFSTLLTGASKAAVVAWVQTSLLDTGTSANRVVSCLMGPGQAGLVLNISNTGGVNVIARSATGDAAQNRTSSATLSTGTVNHVGGVVDFGGGTITPYLNGAASGGGAATFGSSVFAPGTPTANDGIGGDGSPPTAVGQQFAGQIEQVAIWTGSSSSASFAAAMVALGSGDTTPDQIAVNGWTLAFYMKLTDGRPDQETDLAAGKVLSITGNVATDYFTLIAPEPTDDTLILHDEFTGTAGSSIDGRQPDGSGAAWSYGSALSVGSATGMQVDGTGRLQGVFNGAGTTGTAWAYQSAGLPSIPVWMEMNATMLTNVGDVGFATRLLSDTSVTGLVFRSLVASNQWSIRYTIANSATLLTSASQTFVNGTTYNIRVLCGYRAMCMYVNKRLVASTQLNVADFIGQYGHIGVQLTNPGSGPQAATDGWRINSLKVYRAAPQSCMIARGTIGGDASDPYYGYHLPQVALTRDYAIVFAEARLGAGNDTDPIDLVCWRVPKADITSGAAWGTLKQYSPVTIRGDGTSTGVVNHNPLPVVASDGTTVRVLFFKYPSGAVASSPVAGTSGDTALAAVVTSTDQGATWGSATDITTSIKLANEIRLTVGPGTPCKLANGTWVCGMATGTSTAGATTRKPRLIYSTDEGATWSRGAATTYSGQVETSPVERWDGAVYLNVRDHSGNAIDHFVANFADINTETSEGTETALYQANADLPDGMFHSHLKGWESPEYVAIHCNSSIRERHVMRVCRSVDVHTSWDLPINTKKRVLGANMLDDGYCAYSNMCNLDGNSLLVVATGGEQSTTIYSRWLERLSLYLVPRSWLGMAAGAVAGSGTRSLTVIGPTISQSGGKCLTVGLNLFQ